MNFIQQRPLCVFISPRTRTSVPSVFRRWDFHVVFISHNTTVPRLDSRSERPPERSVPRGRRVSRHYGCIRDWTEENKRKYLFLYQRYLYIYAFVHNCLTILYIWLFSYSRGHFYSNICSLLAPNKSSRGPKFCILTFFPLSALPLHS